MRTEEEERRKEKKRKEKEKRKKEKEGWPLDGEWMDDIRRYPFGTLK